MQIIDILKKWFNPGDELYSPAYGYLRYVGFKKIQYNLNKIDYLFYNI